MQPPHPGHIESVTQTNKITDTRRQTSCVNSIITLPTTLQRCKGARLEMFYKFHHGLVFINTTYLPQPPSGRLTSRNDNTAAMTTPSGERGTRLPLTCNTRHLPKPSFSLPSINYSACTYRLPQIYETVKIARSSQHPHVRLNRCWPLKRRRINP